MRAELARRIEKNIQRAASAAFAVAVGYAAYGWLGGLVEQPVLGAETGGAAAFAYLICSRALNAVRPRGAHLAVPMFDLRAIETVEPAELLLGEDDVYRPEAPSPRTTAEPLELDDVLAQIGPDSRIVRLFDPAKMPTAGELKSRIDSHLDARSSDCRSAEAAQALHEALAQLRRNAG
jgi:hypothetical protein